MQEGCKKNARAAVAVFDRDEFGCYDYYTSYSTISDTIDSNYLVENFCQSRLFRSTKSDICIYPIWSIDIALRASIWRLACFERVRRVTSAEHDASTICRWFDVSGAGTTRAAVSAQSIRTAVSTISRITEGAAAARGPILAQ